MKNRSNLSGILSALILALACIVGCIAQSFGCQTLAASLRESGSGSLSASTERNTSLPLNRWTNNGPKGSSSISLAIDKQDPRIIYEGTLAGVFKSRDGGAVWIPTGLPDTIVTFIAIDPSNSNIIYAGASGQLFKSTNAGASWISINNDLPKTDIRSLAIDPARPTLFYPGNGEGVFRSDNGGTNWTTVNNGLNNLDVTVLAIDSGDPNIVYAGTDDGVFKTIDGGANWNASNNGLRGFYGKKVIYALAIAPSSSNIIYAQTDSGVYRSTNGGGSWTVANKGLPCGTGCAIANSLTIDPADPNTVYAGFYYQGVFRSTDGGASWSAINDGFPNFNGYKGIQALAIDPLVSNTVYAGTNQVGLFKSINQGVNWSALNSGQHGLQVAELTLDTSNPNNIYAGTSSGLFKSNDNGQSWSKFSVGLADSYDIGLEIDPNDSNVLYAMNGGGANLGGFNIHKSVDGGGSWNIIGSALGRAWLLAIDPNDSNTIYAANTESAIYKSTDRGGSWTIVNVLSVQSLVIDHHDSKTIYTVSPYCIDDWNCYSTVNKSTNGGRSWTTANSGLPPYVAELAIDPSNSNVIYGISNTSDYPTNSTLFKSSDGGGSWNAVGTGLPTETCRSACGVSSIAIDPTNSSLIYVGTYNKGVFRSADGGASWNPFNDGLTNLNVYSLVIDPSGHFLHAGTWVGVFDIQLAVPPLVNPIDESQFFVRQHYLDFLNREPDADGLAFWTNQITSCGADAECIEVKRINVSAAFFLSIEFQNTGYLIERMYKAAYGDATESSTGLTVPIVRRAELTTDSAMVGQGVVVNSPGWEQKLDANKQSFSLAFVQRQWFIDAYPADLSPDQFVAKLNLNTGNVLMQDEINVLVAELSADPTAIGRANVLMKVAENSLFESREKNRAFVLMQYCGYLRRDPDSAPDSNYTGYQFWLAKLDQFGGDFNQAEMVKAFLQSTEYRQRFASK